MGLNKHIFFYIINLYYSVEQTIIIISIITSFIGTLIYDIFKSLFLKLVKYTIINFIIAKKFILSNDDLFVEMSSNVSSLKVLMKLYMFYLCFILNFSKPLLNFFIKDDSVDPFFNIQIP